MKNLATLLCLTALSSFPLRADSIGHKLDKDLGKMKHALGWDSLNLKPVETDAGGQPTLERDVNADNTVERVTAYHPNGRKKNQDLSVVSKAHKKLIYQKKESWDVAGNIEHSYIQEDGFNKKGDHTTGTLREKDYESGRLIKDVEQKYSPGADSNKVTYVRTASYYDDGEMKERITERPLEDDKQRDTWADEKNELGRQATHSRWVSSRNAWE